MLIDEIGGAKFTTQIGTYTFDLLFQLLFDYQIC